MKEYGLEVPKIDTNGFFTIVFNRLVNKGKRKMSVKNVGKSKRKELILKKIKSNEPFTIITLAKEFRVNEKTIERDIHELKKDGKIKFVGPKRKGHYEIIICD